MAPYHHKIILVKLIFPEKNPLCPFFMGASAGPIHSFSKVHCCVRDFGGSSLQLAKVELFCFQRGPAGTETEADLGPGTRG